MTVAAYPKRLIEVDLPIRRISEHARREKSTHQGHISTLHIWWARRPLAACRAVMCASLWPDPADPLCPTEFREAAARVIRGFAAQVVSSKGLRDSCSAISFGRWTALTKGSMALDPADLNHLNVLRYALLDFIADFANWDNSTVGQYLDAARALTHAAHESLGGAPGTRPLVLDPFAGGGAIPLEALRVGADALASDLNPVAVLLNKVVLEYIPRYGQRLADEARRWGQWVREEAEKDLAELYPKDPDGATAIGYLWARTIQCEGPGCGAEIPLLRSTQISKEGRRWYYEIRETDGCQIAVSVHEGGESPSRPTVSGGRAVCPRQACGYTTSARAVKAQLGRRHGGANDAELLAVYLQSSSGRRFREPTAADLEAVAKARRSVDASSLPQDLINDVRPYKNTRGLSAVTRVGVQSFADMYTARQARALLAFRRAVFAAGERMDDPAMAKAVLTLLDFAFSRLIFQNSSMSRWNNARLTIEGAFGKQALQVVWDFAEANPISSGPANWDGAIEWVAKVVDANACSSAAGVAMQARAQDPAAPDFSVNALFTDPPYFAAIPYSDLSNFFYVWEREFIARYYPELYVDGLINQVDEIIVTNANLGRGGVPKTPEFFRHEMTVALSAANRVVVPGGVGVIVFADGSTTSWEAMILAIIDAGWVVTGSWPIDTELQNRTQATGSASLQSSVHIVCRPKDASTTGDWRDVLAELPVRIHEWMPRLVQEGVVGADAIFACLGPALEIFSRYERVEKASGDQVLLGEYLEHVWAAVSREAMTTIFSGADATGFEPDARLTAMWLWTISTGTAGVRKDSADVEERDVDGGDEDETQGQKSEKGFALEFDAARKIAQGLGAHLERLTSLVHIKGDTARLLPVSERMSFLFKSGDTVPAGLALERKARSGAQLGLFGEPESKAGIPQVATPGELVPPEPGETVLDRLHQAMLLFGRGRGDGLRRFLVDSGAGNDDRLWGLAQALSALYPGGTDEKRWVDGVLARKKGLGF